MAFLGKESAIDPVGFDFPAGKPDAAGYYKARGLRLRSPRHFGEDWNGRAGSDSDLGDPFFSCADGVVTDREYAGFKGL